MGKYLGGGASFGCFGGRKDLMDRFDPRSPNAFSHGGTFNNNVMSMAAGLCGFNEVLTESESRRINELGDSLRKTLNQVLACYRVDGIVLGQGSVMNLHFTAGPVETPVQLEAADGDLLALWHMEMLLRGQYVAARGMLVLSLPFGQKEADDFVAAFDDFLGSYPELFPARG
jgi:glutamate-1-semialdehyde 2,1-aminomutase